MDAWRGIEIVAGGKCFDFVAGNRDERVDRLARVGAVIFADGDDAVPVEEHVGEAQAGRVGERRGVPVKLLVFVVDENDVSAGDGVRAAAVFVNAGADVEVGWREVGAVADENGAAGFARTLFQPAEIVANERNRAEADAFAGDEAGRNR